MSCSPQMRPSFCCAPAPVLNCANGHEEESSQEIGEAEENSPQAGGTHDDQNPSKKVWEQETQGKARQEKEGLD